MPDSPGQLPIAQPDYATARPRLILGMLVAVAAALPLVIALRRVDPTLVAASWVLLTLLLAVSGAYLRKFDREVWADMRQLGVIAALLLGMMYVTVGLWLVFPGTTPYVMPIPLVAMLAAQLSGPRSAFVVIVLTTAAALMMGFVAGAQVVAVLLASVAAIVVFSALTHRLQLVRAGSHIMGASALASGLAAAIGGAAVREIAIAAAEGLVGGGLSAVLAYGLLPFMEQVFGVTTDIRLLELSSPSSPLMRQLMREAPGTYGHSVLTGSLAESGAEAIGANPLLARVGAYYHDIGKLRRPTFFSENIGAAHNPHDETSPSLSALIITAHVREGIELAKQHRLPPEVTAIIRQHHGDSLVSYFFNKAAAGSDPVYEADFRYDGQRPESREAALVMLADGVEAAVRALQQPSRTRIESTVRSVVEEKLADGQLRDSAMTLADIERVIGAYWRILSNVHHSRVEYPEQAKGTMYAGKRRES